MKEIHGVICKKGGSTFADNEMAARVYDGDNFVGLVFSNKVFNPHMTAEEARFLAKQLNQAAK